MPTPKPRPITPLSQSDIARFWSKVDRIDDESSCWTWKAGVCRRGYGKFWCDGATYRAPRIAYYLNTGEDPGDDLILHCCDNSSCCRPNHLKRGDLAENTKDRVDRHRSPTGERWSAVYADRVAKQKGESHPTARFTTQQVIEMRRLYASGAHTQRGIARIFATKQPVVQRILAGTAWRHLPLGGQQTDSDGHAR